MRLSAKVRSQSGVPGLVRAQTEHPVPFAVDVRAGRRIPHPRHWKALAGLAGILPH